MTATNRTSSHSHDSPGEASAPHSGAPGDDRLCGGDETLIGVDGGADVLFGGPGADTLFGGSGGDPGALVLYNAACSRMVPEVIEECGGRALRTRVGHSLIKQQMAETGAAFAGEHSGHYYFAENHNSDSGVLAAVALLEELSRADAPLSDLRRPYDRYAGSGEVNFTVDDPRAVTESLARRYRHQPTDRLDGLAVDCGDWWFNLRPSNTEPLLRLNLEASSATECTRRLAEVSAAIERGV